MRLLSSNEEDTSILSSPSKWNHGEEAFLELGAGADVAQTGVQEEAGQTGGSSVMPIWPKVNFTFLFNVSTVTSLMKTINVIYVFLKCYIATIFVKLL